MILARHLIRRFFLWPPFIRRWLERRRAGRVASTRELYINFVASRHDTELANTKSELPGLAAAAQSYERAYIACRREIFELAQRKKRLETELAACKKRMETEFDKITALDGVVAVRFVGDILLVFTDTLYCANPESGNSYELGKFRIELCTSGSNGTVAWFNLTRNALVPEPGMNAPHVDPWGNACAGSLHEALPEILGEYEFCVAVEMALGYLRTYPVEGDLDEPFNAWPKVEPGTEEVMAE